MVHSLLKAQSSILAAGTAFSWYTLIGDYQRFFEAGGELFQWSGCTVTNPILTPCFYGAIAFLVTLVWSLALLRTAPDRIVQSQRPLNWLLLVGTVFAWSAFGYEMYAAATHRPAPSFSCPTMPQAPFEALGEPCFYGGLMFLAALLISLMIMRSDRAGKRAGHGHAAHSHG